MKKIISILTIFIIMIIIIQNNIFATNIDTNINIGNHMDEINQTVPIIERIMNYLQIVGSIISIIALIIIGFKYMFSSLDEKAKLKGVLIYYIIGALLVFATSNILSVFYNIMKDMTI